MAIRKIITRSIEDGAIAAADVAAGSITTAKIADANVTTAKIASSVTLTTPTIDTITSAAATALTLKSAGTTAVTVDTAQNVGIGTTSPAARLSVDSSSTGLMAVLNSTATNGGYLTGRSSGTAVWDIGTSYQTLTVGSSTDMGINVRSGFLALGTGNTERMRITSAGATQIKSTAGATPTYSFTNNGEGLLFRYNDDSGVRAADIVAIGNTPAGAAMNMRFWTNNTGTDAAAERMRITSAGALLIGQTSASFGGGLCLTKNAQDSIAIFENSTGTSGGQCIRGILGANNNNTSSYLFVGSAASQDNIYIFGNGNVVNRNNSYGSLSDIKLKENVVDASPKLADVMQLKVRNFNFKTDPDNKQIGFIAQEFEEVFPSLIDSTTSPNDPDDVTKAIKTSVLVPILVKAIQELKAINDTQAETINALTARLDAAGL